MIDIARLVDNLPEFYKEHMSSSEFVEYLFKLYAEAAGFILQYANNMHHNLANNSVEAYRTVPFASIDATKGLYSIENILSDKSTETMLGLSDSTLLSRIDAWNNTATMTQKIAVLNYVKAYVDLDASVITEAADNDTVVINRGLVVDAEVYTASNIRLIQGINYVISHNKLFLFGAFAGNSIGNSYVIAKNIVIDYGMIEKRLGSFIGIGYNKAFSKPEYRSITEALLPVAFKGPSLKNLQESLEKAFNWSGFRVLDLYSENNNKILFWSSGTLGEFDFIINMPAVYANDAVKLEILTNYLRLIKPADSNFFINWANSFSDRITITDVPLNLRLTDQNGNDNIVVTVGAGATISRRDVIRDILTADAIISARVDSWDADTRITFDVGGVYFDSQEEEDDSEVKYHNICDITHHTFPEFPLAFTAQKSGAATSIAFTNNSAGATGYRIYRNNALVKDLIPEIMGDGSTLTYTDSPGAGNHQYKAIAYFNPAEAGADTQYSVYTKTVTVTI